MRVLISIDNYSAHYYKRLGMARVLANVADVVLWDISKQNAFDAFDTNNPSVFIGQSYNLKPDLVRVLKERPEVRRVIRVPDAGKFADEIKKKFPILTASEEEMELCESIKPDIVYCHYQWKDLQNTHEEWIKRGFPLMSLMNAADLYEYWAGRERTEYVCDIAFVGGFWKYKGERLQSYLFPLFEDYAVKIFGNSNWNIPQYCGYIKDGVADLFRSASICPCIHEEHSLFGNYDVVERPFKILSSGGFCLSDTVRSLTELIPDGIIYFSDPADLKEKVRYFIDRPDERRAIAEKGRKEVVRNHSYFSRVVDMLRRLGYDDKADTVAAIHREKFLQDE